MSGSQTATLTTPAGFQGRPILLDVGGPMLVFDDGLAPAFGSDTQYVFMGSGASTTDEVTGAGLGYLGVAGSVSVTLSPVSGSGAGVIGVVGSMAVTLVGPTSYGASGPGFFGAGQSVLAEATSTGLGAVMAPANSNTLPPTSTGLIFSLVASAYRTIRLSTVQSFQQFAGSKHVSDILDYTVDFTRVLFDVPGDALATATVAVTPSDMSVEHLFYSNTAVTFFVSGGKAGQIYRFDVEVTTEDGRQELQPVFLTVVR